jgi:pimeloyl-ACP methyl ester carboxylesterase
VLAVHGITASHLAWPMVADALPDVRIIAPDLRGRGGSRHLPGPWGMRQHADDLARLLDARGVERVLVAGHSMGAFASVMFAHDHPDRVAGLVLIDGGLPLPPVEVVDGGGEEVAIRILGPAARRLTMTFPSRDAYLEFWRSHPAFIDDWSDVVEQYVDYDLIDENGQLRSASRLEAVAADTLELNGSTDYFEALAGLAGPVPFLRAPRGLLGEDGGLYPPDVIAEWQRQYPALTVTTVPDVNHYTILMTRHGVAAVAAAIADTLARVDLTPKENA